MLSNYEKVQPIAFNILSNELKNNKISHAYLFDVSFYSDSMNFIYEFIKSILCQNRDGVDSCGKCNICTSVDDKNFPDIYIVESDGFVIKKEQLITLQDAFKTKSLYDNKKIYIIKYAEHLNQASANSILKFLEEPENNIIAILLTKNMNSVIETILSRCQIIKLLPENIADLSAYEKIKRILFEDSDIQSLFESLELSDIIKSAVNFAVYYEKNGIDTISRTSNLWFEVFTDKKLNGIGYNLLLLFYKDVINVKLGRKVECFDEYTEDVLMVSEKNSLLKLYAKVRIIIDTIDRNKINANLALNLDNLIIRMEGAND